MTPEEIRTAVLVTLATIAPETDAQRIAADRPLRDQIDLDSLDWLNVIAGLNARLGVDLTQSDAAQLATLDAIVACVAAKQAQPGADAPHALPPAPAQLSSTRHVIGGTTVTVRPIRPQDMELEAEFVHHLSTEARYKRFMVTVNELSKSKLKYLTDVDQVRHVALVATVERDGKEALVGVVRYVVERAGTSCEFAIAIDDAWHGSGLAGILMHALMDIARARGLATMEGAVLATNSRMLKFMRQLGFERQRDPDELDAVRVVRTL